MLLESGAKKEQHLLLETNYFLTFDRYLLDTHFAEPYNLNIHIKCEGNW